MIAHIFKEDCMNNEKGIREALKARIKAARDKLIQLRDKCVSGIKLTNKKANTSKEVTIETMNKKLDKIEEYIDRLTDEDIINYDDTELKEIENYIINLEKSKQSGPLGPSTGSSIKIGGNGGR